MLTHSMELETPPWSDVDKTCILQRVPCQVLASPCHCRSKHLYRKGPVDFIRHWSFWLQSPRKQPAESGVPKLCKPNRPKFVHIKALGSAHLEATFSALLWVLACDCHLRGGTRRAACSAQCKVIMTPPTCLTPL